MPLVNSYDEASLATFMVNELGAVATALGITVTSDVIDGSGGAVLATARLLGDDIADLTDMAVLESAARWQAWRAAEAAILASPNKLKSDGDELDYSQRLSGIQARIVRAESDYYSALAVSGGLSGGFVFATICGGRGR